MQRFEPARRLHTELEPGQLFMATVEDALHFFAFDAFVWAGD